MAFGENVGSAYVKLYVNGDSVPSDIKDSLDELDPLMKEAGERHSEKYHEGFNEQIEKDGPETREHLYASLQKGLGRMHGIGETLGSDFFDGLQLQLTEELGDSDLGKLIREKLEDDFALTGSFDKLKASLEDINRVAIVSQMELDDFEDQVRSVISETDKAAESNDDWRTSIQETHQAIIDLDHELEIGNGHMSEALSHVRSLDDESRTWADGFRGHLHNLNVELDHSATLTGKIFGKGSRNDFLNIVGSMVEGLTRLVYAAPNLLEKLMGGGPGGGGPGASAIIKAVGGSLVGLAIAVGALLTALGPLAALASGISAAVIGLVGSLGFAASAVGGVAFALTGPLVAGIGIGIAALTHLDKETKDKLGAVSDMFGKLASDAGNAIGPGLRAAVDTALPAISRLRPLFIDTSDAIGGVAESFADLTTTPAYNRFIADITAFIPDAIDSLGDSASNLTRGLMGVFRSAIPGAETFLGWLEKVTDRFADWVNTRDGQETMVRFFERAGDSARSVGGFIADATKALGELLGQGKDSGDTIFDELAEKMRQFTDYLKDNPDAVHDFFENGIQVAEDLGNLVLDLGDFIDKLDNKETRDTLHQIFGILEQTIEIIGDIESAVTKVQRVFLGAYGYVAEFGGAVRQAAHDTADLAFAIVGAPKKATDALVNAFAGIHWGAIIPDIHWNQLIPDVKWKQIIPNVKWSQFIPFHINWSSLLPHLKWSAIIPDVRWSEFIPDIRWSSLLPHLKWSDIIPDVKWGDLIPDIQWSDIIPDINWSDFVPDLNVHINWPDPPGWLSKLGGGISGALSASGGTFYGAQQRTIAEAGPEAVVPLNRPLNQVDPSVRHLSAIAQGMVTPGNSGGGTVIEKGAIVVVEAADGQATAHAMLNQLVARLG